MRAFIDRHGLDGIDHLVDDDGSLWERFGVTSQPSWVFVDDDGSAERVFGRLGQDGLEQRIDALAAT